MHLEMHMAGDRIEDDDTVLRVLYVEGMEGEGGEAELVSGHR